MPYMNYLKSLQTLGVGEIFLNFIYKDGTWTGYDLDMIDEITNQLDVPVIVCGGASDRQSFAKSLASGASAVAAGSIFVYMGKDKGVLVNYPERAEVEEIFRMAKI